MKLNVAGWIFSAGKADENRAEVSERKIAWLINFLLFLFAVVLLLADHYEALTFLPEEVGLLAEEIAFAIIVALVLIYTIEKSAKERHERAANALIERINTDLFHAIYKRSIPSDVFGEVEKCLLRATVYRTEYGIIYVFKRFELETHENHVLCEAQTSYKLTNITDSNIQHPVQLLVEIPIEKNMAK